MKNRLYCCAFCGVVIGTDRPVFLLVDKTNEIRGPLHAECARALGGSPVHTYTNMSHAPRLFGMVRAKLDWDGKQDQLDGLEVDQ